MTRSRSALALALLTAAILPSVAAAAPPLSPASVARGHYVLDKRHASVTARALHEGVSMYTLRFDSLDASFDYDPGHPEATRLTASVDPASLDANGDWSKEFAEKFLQASKFPAATFVSTGVQSLGGPQGTVTGDLTLMGVTKSVTFNVTLVGAGHEMLPIPFGQDAVGFEAVATIKRFDFGSTYVKSMVGDDVTLTIEGEFDHK